MTTRLHLACSATENYARPLCGMLSSFFLHHRDVPVTIHILAGSISRPSLDRLEQFIRRHGAECRPHLIPDGEFQDLILHRKHFAKAVFYRFLIPDLVTDTDRILYLDVDLFIRRSLLPLFQTDLGGHPLAAVPDAWPPADCRRLGIPEHQSYFNAGVLLMDLPAWRRDGIAARAIDFLSRHNGDAEKCRYADQDGLNAVLAGRWQRLPEDWNFNIYFCSVDPATLPEPRRALLREGPAIIHYASNKKPWMREYRLPFQGEFLQHARKQGIHFSDHLTIRGLWSQIGESHRLHRLKSQYHRAGIPWRP